MIKLLFALVVTLCMGCSTPKYAYYFDRYSVKCSVSPQNTLSLSNAKDDEPENSLSIISETSTVQSAVEIQAQSLVASSSKGCSYSAVRKEQNGFNSPKISFPKRKREERKILLKSVKEFKADMKSQDAVKEGDKGKNGFAIAGLIFSLIGIGVLIAGSGLGLLFCGVAIILSAVGLKSELRNLASVVLTLELGAALLLSIFIAFVLLTWQFTI